MARNRSPLRHASVAAAGQPLLRTKTVVWTVVALLVLVAGLTALLWLAFDANRHEAASNPTPRVTVTASPDGETLEPATADGSGPITAQSAPESELTHDAPAIVVGPGIDLSQHSFDDPASPWVVVNKVRPIDPQSWAPAELERVGEAELVPQAAVALQNLIDDAATANLQLRTGSGYRAYGFQESIYGDYAAEHGAERADRFSARPGYSEHQTGWAVDMYGNEQCRIKECFADEPAGVWLADHAHEYGFVIRYPQDAESITGYRFEPWHIRYVGVELATAMHEHGIATLEEALSLPAAPDYD